MLNISASKIILDLPVEALKLCTKEQKRLATANRVMPHITLGMAVLDYSNADGVRRAMRVIAKQSKRIDLSFKALASSRLYGEADNTLYFELELNKKLWELHLLVMKYIQPYTHTEHITSSMFVGDTKASDQTITSLQHFETEYAFKHWKPVIELGM